MDKDSNNTSVIITINDDSNYGNRLQNYALSLILKQYMDCSTVYMYVENSQVNSVSFLKSLFYLVKRFAISSLRFIVPQLDKKFLINKRIENNKEFSRRYIPTTFFLLSSSGFKSNCSKQIRHVVIGSDQVWNYRWVSKDDLAFRLGSFVPDGIPIISYAASFGVSEVSDDVKPIFQKYLPRLTAISVREDRGAELVKEITGSDSTVVLDPTLMLNTDQWDNITHRFVPDDDQYVLTYFLGRPSAEQERAIQNYAKARSCRIRRILDLRDKETYVAGPQDFVELFSKAQYVFTDSYHACCFSILYHKQFTVFNRAGMEGKANMNSRMETLFRLFDLDSVVMDKGLAPQIDYDKVDKLLAQHRAESQVWLDKAMEA